MRALQLLAVVRGRHSRSITSIASAQNRNTDNYYTQEHKLSHIMASLQDAGIQAAETLQTAHINPSPSIEHDVNPSTAASEKEPVRMDRSPSEDILSDIDEDEVPLSILRPAPRKPQMPLLPDLRFEQSYLASIKDAKDWKVVTYITMRDQVCFLFLE